MIPEDDTPPLPTWLRLALTWLHIAGCAALLAWWLW